MWLNGRIIHKVQTEGISRPNYAGDERSYLYTNFKKGWDQFFIKIIRKDKPVKTHFVISGSAPFYHGFVDLIEYKFPWEV